jgi:hypothetical protein
MRGFELEDVAGVFAYVKYEVAGASELTNVPPLFMCNCNRLTEKRTSYHPCGKRLYRKIVFFMHLVASLNAAESTTVSTCLVVPYVDINSHH